MLPGFIDSHNHVRLGSNPLEVDLAGAATLDEVQARIRAHADAHPEHDWIEGVGFNYSAMPGGRMPRAAGPRRAHGRPARVPADLRRAQRVAEPRGDGAVRHHRDTDALAWGHVRKDPERRADRYRRRLRGDGHQPRRPAGPARGSCPATSAALQYERTLESIDMATAFGITTIVEPQNSPDDLWIFERARDEGRLRSRLVAAMFHPVGHERCRARRARRRCAHATTTTGCASGRSSSTSTTWSSRGPPRCSSRTRTGRGSGARRSGDPTSSQSS